MSTKTFAVSLLALAIEVSAAGTELIDYKTSGANWGDHYPLCKYGEEQSPIDLTKTGTKSSEQMQVNGFGYQNMALATTTRNANTIVTNVADGEFQIDFPDGSKSLFTPAQFHLHAPSEHSVNGSLYDMELHIVHQYKDQPAALGAVIGVFFDRKAGGNYDNPLINSLKFGATQPDIGLKTSDVNLASFLGGLDFSRYWSYKGSLTTPPCTEGIKWTVLEQVQPISDAQLLAFTQYFAGNTKFAQGKGNDRVVQPLGKRTLYYNSATGIATNLFAFALAAYVAF